MFFILSTGRSGTNTLAKTLSVLPTCKCIHEPSPELVEESSAYRYGKKAHEEIKRILLETRKPTIDGKIYGESNQTLSLIIPVLIDAFPKAQYVWLLRNGLDVIASTFARQWYTGHSSNHDRYEDCPPIERMWIDGRIMGDRCGDVPERQWQDMDPFAKCCWYWSYVNRTIEQDIERYLPTGRSRQLTLENINEEIHALTPWLGLGKGPLSRVEVHNRAHYSVHHPSQWTEGQRETFNYWCGPMMDKLYPGWKERMGWGIYRGLRPSTDHRGGRDAAVNSGSAVPSIFYTPKTPTKPRISVFLPSYNQKTFLVEALESVLNQTYTPNQIIVVDDCSTDGSQAVIENYSRQYPGIFTTIYHNKNMGIAQTRIDALSAVTGDFVTYLDGDDRFLPEKSRERTASPPELSRCAYCIFKSILYVRGWKAHGDMGRGGTSARRFCLCRDIRQTVSQTNAIS